MHKANVNLEKSALSKFYRILRSKNKRRDINEKSH